MPRAASILLLLAASLTALPAVAKRIYQYRDEAGVLHFTDRKPGESIAEVKETVVKVERQPIVDLVTSDAGSVRQLSFRNLLAGPVELELAFGTLENMVLEPESPVRVVLPL